MDGVSGISDYQCQQLLGKSAYHRIQIRFSKKESIPLDAVKKLPRMIELAEDYDLAETVEWMRKNWILD